MAKSQTLSPDPKRSLKLTLEPVSGSITMFYAFVDQIKVIQSDGTKKRMWNGEIAEAQVKVKIRVLGIGEAEFKLGIDLPGNVNDQSLVCKLSGGYYETSITL
jgi:hypothetical protein